MPGTPVNDLVCATGAVPVSEAETVNVSKVDSEELVDTWKPVATPVEALFGSTVPFSVAEVVPIEVAGKVTTSGVKATFVVVAEVTAPPETVTFTFE